MKPNDLSFLLNSSNLSPVTSKGAVDSLASSAATRKRKSISIDFLLDTPRKLQKVVNNVTESSPLLSQPSSAFFSQRGQQQCEQQYTIQPIPLPSPKLQVSDHFGEPECSLKPRRTQQPPSPLSLSAILASPPSHSPVLSSQSPVSHALSSEVPAPTTNQRSPLMTPAAQTPSPKVVPSLSTLKIASALRTRLTYAKIKLQNGWESKSLSRIERMNISSNSNSYSERANTCDRILISSDRVSSPEPYQALSDSGNFHQAHRSSHRISKTPTST